MGILAAMKASPIPPLTSEGDSGDLDLLRRFTNHGEREALAALLTRHADAAYRLALRFSGNATDAEDAVQSAFLQILSAADKFRGASTVKTWILGFVVHACQRQAETSRRRKAREAVAVKEETQTSAGEEDERKEAVLEAIQRLPMHFRLPLWLHYYEGLKPQDVALALEQPESTIRNQLSRGLEQVREALGTSGAAFTSASLGAAIAALPQVHAPASLVAALPGLLTQAPVALSASTAGSTKSASLLGGTAMKITVAAVLATAAATSAVLLSNKGDTAEPAMPAPETAPPAGEEKAAPKGNPQAPLGSPEWQPTAECPAGWRGDGTGRYLGATPATEWTFHVKTVLDELRCCGAKPKDSDGKSGEQLPLGRIQDWVVLGPYPATDPATALNQEFIANEAALQPAAGDAAGDKAWKVFHSGGENHNGVSGAPGADLHIAFGELQQHVGYAFTNLFAPRDLKVRMSMHIPNGSKIWFNGEVIHNDLKPPYASSKKFELSLKQGWNRMLCKVLSGNTLYDHRVSPIWRIAASIAPLDPPSGLDRKNIVWMSRMPGDTCSAPTVAGDRIFVSAHYSTLLCLNKSDGKVLWIRTNLFAESLSEEERNSIPVYKDKIVPGIAKLNEMNEQIAKELNALPPPDAQAPPESQKIEERLNTRAKLERDIDGELEKVDGKKYRSSTNQHLGTSNGAPLCDGKNIWVVHGGGIYTGTMTVACYDLDGKRLWIQGFLANSGEHGNHSTLALADGKVVLTFQDAARAFDALTGAPAWQGKLPSGKTGGGSPLAVKIGNETLVLTSTGDFLNPADGKAMGKLGCNEGCGTFVWDGGNVYGNSRAYKVSGNSGGAVQSSLLFDVKNLFPSLKKPPGFMGSPVASPLVYDGLVYTVSEGGVMSVFDAAKGEVVYTRILTELYASVSWVFNPGVCASPALAGKYIYIAGDNGIVMVLQPGREFKLVALNKVDHTGGQTLATPVFEGPRMYYRTPAYLFCIGEK